MIVFSLLALQAFLVKLPTLELLVSLVVVLYIIAASKELKTRREPFTRKQKNILFGLVASVYGSVLTALLIAGLIKQTPLVWIVFGLALVFSFVILVHDYEQLYGDEDSA